MTRATAEAILDAIVQGLRDDGDVALCEALDMLGQRTGKNKFQHAANIVRGTKLGRHPINDRLALWRIARGESVSEVAGQVARPDEKVTSVERRLRRKLDLNKTSDVLLMSEESIE